MDKHSTRKWKNTFRNNIMDKLSNINKLKKHKKYFHKRVTMCNGLCKYKQTKQNKKP